VDTLADVVKACTASGGGGVGNIRGADVTPMPIGLVGGDVLGETTIRLPKTPGFAWDGAHLTAEARPTRSVLALLGGAGTITNLTIDGGSCLGQLTIGLDQNRQSTGGNVPKGIIVDGFDIGTNPGRLDGTAWSFEMLHAVYVNTTNTGPAQDIMIRNGAAGPVVGGGPVIKLGGDGGCRVVTLENVHVRVGTAKAADGQLPRSLLVANTTAVVVRNMSIDYPSIIDIQGGAQVTFDGGWREWPKGTKVLAKIATVLRFGSFSWTLRTQAKWLLPGQGAPGIAWR
jgi:hypothetical protein